MPTATPTIEPAATQTPIPPLEPESDAPVIVLDPGHDRTTPGALGIEYQIVLEAALIIEEALEAAGYRVEITRRDNDFAFDEHPELLPENASEMHPGYGKAYAHASQALRFDPDMVFVLHFNGHPDPAVAGSKSITASTAASRIYGCRS
jgi:N-acetylmuramoyl-L-alanine amidase